MDSFASNFISEIFIKIYQKLQIRQNVIGYGKLYLKT